MKFPRHKLYISFKTLFFSFLQIIFYKEKISSDYKKLKKSFSKYYQTDLVYFLSTWRIGLYLILNTYNFEKNDEMLVTGIGIPDTINSVRLAGLKPIFVDMDLETHNVDILDLKKKISLRTKVLHITYLSGLVPNMDEIIDICKKNNLILIEDISQAYGANYKGKLCGTFGDASIGSFSLGKTISSNGGGVVIINNAKLEDKFNKLFEDSLNLPSKLFLLKINFNQLIIKFLTSRIIFNFFTFYLFRFIKKFFRNTFNDPEMKNKIFLNINRKNYYKNIPEIRQKFPEILFKKMSDSQCQLAQECFDNLDVNNKKIRNLANLYIKKLNKKFTNNIPKSAYNIPQNTFWHFPLHVLNNYDLFQDYLFKINADCVSYGLPLLTEIDIFSRYASNLDNSNLVKKNTIFLPIHSDYLEKDINYLINKINDYKYEI